MSNAEVAMHLSQVVLPSLQSILTRLHDKVPHQPLELTKDEKMICQHALDLSTLLSRICCSEAPLSNSNAASMQQQPQQASFADTSTVSPAKKSLVKQDSAKAVPAKRTGRKKGKITDCPHLHLPLYAMGMCNHCYHKYGRSSMATECSHAGARKVYALGKC